MSIYVLVGRRELGKSTLARYMAWAKAPRIFIDPRAQWRGPRVYRREQAEEMLEDLERGEDVIVQPSEKQPTVDAMASVAALWLSEENVPAGEEPKRQLSVVLDEAGTYDLDSWDWFFRTCPTKRTTIVLTAHRPQDIETSVRAIADYWCIFRTTQTHDLKAIEERTNELVVREVQSLKPFEFVQWNDRLAEMEVNRNPAAWKEPRAEPLRGKVIEPIRERRLWE